MTKGYIARKLKKISKRIEKLQKMLEGLPEGKFIFARNGRHYKWYVSDGKKKTYIPKENLEYAQKLAYKNFLLKKKQLYCFWHLLYQVEKQQQQLHGCLLSYLLKLLC